MATKQSKQQIGWIIAIVVIVVGIFVYYQQKPKVLVADCQVHLGDFDWDSANVHTAIASFILEKGYGCELQVTKGSTTPIMAALFDQQIDIITEVWRDK